MVLSLNSGLGLFVTCLTLMLAPGSWTALTGSSYADSCARAHVAYNGELMGWGRDLEGEGMAAE